MMEKMNKNLEGKKSLSGTFSLADIALCETITNGPALMGPEWETKFPNIKAYFDACAEEMPSIKENAEYVAKRAAEMKEKFAAKQ